MSLGVVYVAIGKKFIDEACYSATSLKERMPNLDITIFSNENVQHGCFDKCLIIESSQNGYIDKIVGMSQTPYDYTLFIDSDTYICSDFSEIFTLLDKYDIGAALAELRAGKNQLGEIYSYQELVDEQSRFIYPIYNSGVIVYKKSFAISHFFSKWLNLAKQQMQEKGMSYGDQPSFQLALHQSDLRQVVLPHEYNCRFIFPVCISGTVKILHGRTSNFPELAKAINVEISTRVFHPKYGLVTPSALQMLKKIILVTFYKLVGKKANLGYRQ